MINYFFQLSSTRLSIKVSEKMGDNLEAIQYFQNTVELIEHDILYYIIVLCDMFV